MRFAFLRSWSAIPFLTCFAAGIVSADPRSADPPAIERLEPASEPPAEVVHPAGSPAPVTPEGFRLGVQGGYVRWKWNEVVPDRVQLQELGFVPLLKAHGSWRKGMLGLEASLELLSGALDYDGYLQSRVDGSLVPYESNTHYLAVTPSLSCQLRGPASFAWVRPTVSLSRPWWRRTIDSERDLSPGPVGYVEIWSVLTTGFGLELERTYRRDYALAIHGEIQVPLSTSERIGWTKAPTELEPKTRTGVRWRARLTYRNRAHLEVDALRMGFDESEPVMLADGTGDWVYQPESSLDRVAWKVGWIF